MSPEEKLKEATTYDIFKTIAGCHKFIEIATNEIKRRMKESSYGTCVCGTEKDDKGCPNGH